VTTDARLDGVDAESDLRGAGSVARAAPLEPVAMLVRAAIDSDEPRPVLLAGASVAGRALGLVGESGEPLGGAPDDERGSCAQRVATATADGSAVPAAWSVRPVGEPARPRALLAVGPDEGRDAVETAAFLDMLAALLGEQLTRVALKQAQAEALVRRLVGDPSLSAQRARREAGAVGLVLAPFYRVAVVVWRGDPAPRVKDLVLQNARSALAGTLVALLDRRLILLAPAVDRGLAERWLGQVVAHLRALAPSSHAQAIVAESAVEPAALSACFADLPLPSTSPGAEDPPVVSAGRYALDRLLRRSLPAGEATRFVEDRLGRLIAWDRQHGTDLLRVLEAALDAPRHDEAARRCYMHRNTFRRHLRQAMELLRAELDDPQVRLAVHVALKLRPALPDLQPAPGDQGG
jgi:hypothetical protein